MRPAARVVVAMIVCGAAVGVRWAWQSMIIVGMVCAGVVIHALVEEADK
jgi:hypothetical protein